jgi:hypothetical protein
LVDCNRRIDFRCWRDQHLEEAEGEFAAGILGTKARAAAAVADAQMTQEQKLGAAVAEALIFTRCCP